MTITLSKKQGITIAAILAVGALLAALILFNKPAGSGHDEEAGHQEEHNHQEESGHKEEPGHKEESGHKEAAGHDDDEGNIVLSAAAIRNAGITLLAAGPGAIESGATLPGEIRLNDDRTAHVVPRLAGVVEGVSADLGARVKKGQVLAVIASTGLSELRSELLSARQRLELARASHQREQRLWQDKISAEQDYQQAAQTLHEAEIAVRNASQKLQALGVSAAGGGQAGALNRYEIRAPFDGMILEKHIALGEAVKEDANIFLISDLSSVWAEIAVPAKDLHSVKVGARATVKAGAFEGSASGRVQYVGALLGEQTRTAKARITLANPDLAWRPGLFVNVDIASGAASPAAVAVAAEALHQVDGKTVLFVRTAGGFKAQAVAPGRSDGKLVEITQGLPAGATYAAAGSFVLKSELGKASAGHEH